MALDGIYFAGGHTTLNGVKSDNEQRNTRAGFTLALPVDRQNSLKLSASTGLSTRTGSEFNAVGIAWQYRLGEGYCDLAGTLIARAPGPSSPHLSRDFETPRH